MASKPTLLNFDMAKQGQSLKPEKESIYPHLRFILIGGRRPFPWDNELETLAVYADYSKPVIPPPPSENIESTNYLNRFLRTEPESPNSDPEPLAVAIIKAIAFPSERVIHAVESQNLGKNFVNAISNACAVTATDDDIRGGELARIYRLFPHGNVALANCVAVLIGLHVGSEKGGPTPFQLRHLTKRSIESIAKKLCDRFEDFETYYQAVVQDPQMNEHLMDIEVATAQAVEALRPKRLRHRRQDSRPEE